MEVGFDTVPSLRHPATFVDEANATSAVLSFACVAALAVGAFAARKSKASKEVLALLFLLPTLPAYVPRPPPPVFQTAAARTKTGEMKEKKM